MSTMSLTDRQNAAIAQEVAQPGGRAEIEEQIYTAVGIGAGRSAEPDDPWPQKIADEEIREANTGAR